MDFKDFLIESEDKDLKTTLAKLPKKHQKLLKGYEFKFQSGNSLTGDNGHVGVIDDHKKTITVAAPWFYPREFTVLHEVGHLVWKHCMDKNMKMQWSKIVKSTKNKQKDNDEELFCHAYAATYSKNSPDIHDHEKWTNFIRKLV